MTMKTLILFLAFAATALAQPLSVGGYYRTTASAFSPADLDSLRAWYVASDVTGKNDGDTLYHWPDKSGNGRHLYQLTASLKPTYQTGESNGQPGVQFDGSGDFMTHAESGGAKRGQHIVFIWKSTSAAASYALTFGTGGDNAFITGFVAGKAEFYNTPRVVVGDRPSASYVADMVNDSLAVGRRSVYRNGAHTGTNTGVGIRTNSDIIVGSNITGANPAGLIALEIIIYDGARSAAEIAQLWQYVQTKYGL